MTYEEDKPGFKDLIDDPPHETVVEWIVFGIVLIINYFFSYLLFRRCFRLPPSKRRKYVFRIICAIPIISTYAYLTLYFVKSIDAMTVIQKWYQGVIMYSFYGWTMTWFVPPYEEITSQNPMKHLNTLPLCCFSYCFCPGERSVTPKLLKSLKYGMGQLGIVQVILVIILVVADINGKYDQFYFPVKIASLISMMLSVYCCNVLVKITATLIPERRVFFKSRAILLLIVLVNVQELVLGIISKNGGFSDDDTYDAETKGQLWSSCLQLSECFFYGLLLNSYWPIEENIPEPGYTSLS